LSGLGLRFVVRLDDRAKRRRPPQSDDRRAKTWDQLQKMRDERDQSGRARITLDALKMALTLEMMEKTVGKALDPACFAALKQALARLPR
jgi:hypothetical protein